MGCKHKTIESITATHIHAFNLSEMTCRHEINQEWPANSELRPPGFEETVMKKKVLVLCILAK